MKLYQKLSTISLSCTVSSRFKGFHPKFTVVWLSIQLWPSLERCAKEYSLSFENPENTDEIVMVRLTPDFLDNFRLSFSCIEGMTFENIEQELLFRNKFLDDLRIFLNQDIAE